MSGPKDYSPPPRYSMSVFNGNLNRVFDLQCRLKTLFRELENSGVTNPELNISFDCSDGIKSIRREVESALKSLLFDYKGTFGQEVYNRISSEINTKVNQLNDLIQKCDFIKNDFTNKKKDYDIYLNYLRYYDTSKISYNDFQSRVLHNLKTNLEKGEPVILAEAAARIDKENFALKKALFEFGFVSASENKKQNIVDYVTHLENNINGIRADISNKVLNTLGAQAPLVIKKKNKDVENVIAKIEQLINKCEDVLLKNNYKAELEKISNSDSLTDVYYFKELHDFIYETESSRKLKHEIEMVLIDLNRIEFHKSVIAEKQLLINHSLLLLKSNSISKSEVENIYAGCEKLKTTSSQKTREDEISEKENMFLKSQLILSLENLGYEVMDDLEVIDFEKETDFLLKVNNQENYLNLKFKEDGSIRYVFQIPESTDDLSTDQKNKKLHEMKITCDEFKTVLSDLNKMGLKMNLRSEKPIEESYLLSVPNKHRAKLKTKSKKVIQTQQLRKKYLG